MPSAAETLLGRRSLRWDLRGARERIEGQNVLVTGAAGSIGTALVRELLAADPARLVLIDASEHGLYRLAERLRDLPAGRCRPALADLTDPAALRAAIGSDPPHVAFHAAAYKQVELLESQPLAALRNNVLGTKRLFDALDHVGCMSLVMISTDKAVLPAGIMGASKRLAEMMLAARRGTALRLGNVLGSRGSVLPRFRRQIRQGEPLTVTDPDATRFFLTPREAAQLTLATLAVSRGGDLFAPELGPPLPVVELARRLLRQAGRSDGPEAIVFTGLRPGEKRTEQLYAPPEQAVATDRPGLVRIVGPRPDPDAVRQWLAELELRVAAADRAGALEVVANALGVGAASS